MLLVTVVTGSALLACSPATQPSSGEAAAQGVTVVLSPDSAQIGPGESISFSAAVYGTSNSAIEWSVGESGGGTIEPTGRYTAPAQSGTYHVVARSSASSVATDVATVTVGASGSSSGTGGGAGSGGGTAGGGSGGSGAGTGTPPNETVTGPEYFASPTGGGETCSSASPCSLSGVQSKVAGLARPLDEQVTVTLQQGDYTTPLALDAADSGTDATRTVVWRADPNAPAGSVRLLGGTKVTGWTRLDSTNGAEVWSRIHPAAKSGSSSYLFFKDLDLGSYPYSFDDAGREHCDLDSVPGEDYGVNCTSGATLELYISKTPAGYACPAGRQCPVPAILARYPNVQSDGRNSWATSWSGRSGPSISSPLPYVSQFIDGLPYWTTHAAGTGAASDGGYLYNVLEELDQAGEYWIDRSSGRAYLWPLTDADPSATGEVIVGTTEGPILTLGSSSHDIEVRGLVIEGGQTDCVALGGASNKLTYSTVRNCAANAITMTGAGHLVDHDAVYNSGNDDIVAAAAGSTVSNNRVSEFGRFRHTSVAAIRVVAQDIHVTHNRIHDGPAYGVLFGRSGMVMEYNDLSRVPLDGSDNGMIYVWASQSTDLSATVRYNYFHDAPRSQTPVNWGSAALYFDDNTNGMTVYGNVLYCIGSCAGSGVSWRIGSITKGTNTYRNNLFVDMEGERGAQIEVAEGGYTADQNLFVNSGDNGSDGTDYASLPEAGTADFVCEDCSPRDLSNGEGRFSSAVFSSDPSGLSYIPWSSIGIAP